MSTVVTRTAAALRALADAVEKEDILVTSVATDFADRFNANGQPVASALALQLRHPEATAKTMESVTALGKAMLTSVEGSGV